jgi:hypothetical protein
MKNFTNYLKNISIAMAFLFSAAAFAGTVQFNCSVSNDTISGTLNEDGTGVITLNGQDHAATGTYKVYEKGTYCYHSDVMVMNVFADDHSVGMKSVRGDTCGGNDGDLLLVDGNKQAGQCVIENN